MKRLYGALFFIALLVAALYLPIRIPFGADSIGRVWPVQEWRLVQDQTGRITSVVRDHRSGTAQQIDAFQFEQGDISGLRFEIPAGGFVRAGDTIVRMYSIRQRELIQEIEAQLALYGAQLQSDRTGDKPPVVQEAENRLHFAEQDLVWKEKNYQIQKRLLAEQLIALTEFQVAENDFELARIQVDIARKYLETVNTGLKPESIGVTQAQLAGLRNRLAILKQKGLSFVLRAPFDGFVQPSVLPEELLVLNRADQYLVQVPVRVEQLHYLGPSTRFSITDMQSQKTYPADFLAAGAKVEVLGNRQVSFIAATLQPDSVSARERLTVGIAARCRITFDTVDQREYLRRILNFSWTQ